MTLTLCVLAGIYTDLFVANSYRNIQVRPARAAPNDVSAAAGLGRPKARTDDSAVRPQSLAVRDMGRREGDQDRPPLVRFLVAALARGGPILGLHGSLCDVVVHVGRCSLLEDVVGDGVAWAGAPPDADVCPNCPRCCRGDLVLGPSWTSMARSLHGRISSPGSAVTRVGRATWAAGDAGVAVVSAAGAVAIAAGAAGTAAAGAAGAAASGAGTAGAAAAAAGAAGAAAAAAAGAAGAAAAGTAGACGRRCGGWSFAGGPLTILQGGSTSWIFLTASLRRSATVKLLRTSKNITCS